MLVDNGLGHRGLFMQGDAKLFGPPGQNLVEVEPCAYQAVVGKTGQLWPGQLDAHAARQNAQPLVLEPACLGAGIDAELHQLLHGTRGEPVTTDLLAREGALLQQRDVEPRLSEMRGGGGSGRSGTDHDDVGLRGRRAGGNRVRIGDRERRRCGGDCLACHGFTTLGRYGCHALVNGFTSTAGAVYSAPGQATPPVRTPGGVASRGAGRLVGWRHAERDAWWDGVTRSGRPAGWRHAQRATGGMASRAAG